ncbi:MAG: cysteine--tRNA ligase [Holosporales bacterium]|nr:cysteine--tRNA ligase [Holosporales bacterium]
MPIVLYNTLSRQKESFRPLKSDQVGLYVCGPTVYDTAHIGNARSVVVFDILYRLLCFLYPKVTYVRNITDIDDKIINAAREKKLDILQLTQQTTEKFHQDMAALQVLSPTHEPRATAYVPQMIQMIQSLMEKGYAYLHEGHVLFSVENFESYGQLSRLSLEEQKVGARVEVAPYKKNPADFVLWKPSPHEPFFPGWDSPWGYGRPGWHIECSAMSADCLGVPFDIHGGGQDLIFPHHENEIAQSCCALGTNQLARFWMHNGILTVNGEKMSKSLGNFITVDAALDFWPGEVIRWFLLSAHYRQSLDWTQEALLQAKTSLDRLYGALRDGEKSVEDREGEEFLDAGFLLSLQEDLNTPQAFAYLHSLASLIYKTSDSFQKEKIALQLKRCGRLLGFFAVTPALWFQQGSSSQQREDTVILGKIRAREEARKKRNFLEADRIREELLEEGIVLEDGPKGTFWKRI